jgi:hypothetical protein
MNPSSQAARAINNKLMGMHLMLVATIPVAAEVVSRSNQITTSNLRLQLGNAITAFAYRYVGEETVEAAVSAPAVTGGDCVGRDSVHVAGCSMCWQLATEP